MTCSFCLSEEHADWQTCLIWNVLFASEIDDTATPQRVITHTCDDPCWCQS